MTAAQPPSLWRPLRELWRPATEWFTQGKMQRKPASGKLQRAESGKMKRHFDDDTGCCRSCPRACEAGDGNAGSCPGVSSFPSWCQCEDISAFSDVHYRRTPTHRTVTFSGFVICSGCRNFRNIPANTDFDLTVCCNSRRFLSSGGTVFPPFTHIEFTGSVTLATPIQNYASSSCAGSPNAISADKLFVRVMEYNNHVEVSAVISHTYDWSSPGSATGSPKQIFQSDTSATSLANPRNCYDPVTVTNTTTACYPAILLPEPSPCSDSSCEIAHSGSAVVTACCETDPVL